MNREDRRIREYFSRLQESPQRDALQAGLRRTIERSKDAYCDAQAQESLSAAEFLYRQGGYIRKRWWLAQGLVLFGLWFLLGSADGGDTPRRMLGAGGPLFAVLALPELWKSRNANVLEIESVSYFSLRQIYAACGTLRPCGKYRCRPMSPIPMWALAACRASASASSCPRR